MRNARAATLARISIVAALASCEREATPEASSASPDADSEQAGETPDASSADASVESEQSVFTPDLPPELAEEVRAIVGETRDSHRLSHLYSAVRYVEKNPVRAGLCERAEEYPWSSAKAHLAGADDVLVRVAPVLSRWPDWERVLCGPGEDESSLAALGLHGRPGRPLGDEAFATRVGELVGRDLTPGRPGRSRKTG